MFRLNYILLLALVTLNGCSQKKDTMSYKHTNALIHESSPYLLQHAHNPVNWEPWSTEALEKAKNENKLVLISIGYAACHWCHVMEKECFEDEEVAKLMNENFINIKIDREERPDIDHLYMDAVQMMTGRGGWPLNVVTLPDGRPFWGATYVKKDNWMKVLNELTRLYREQPGKVNGYARDLAEGIKAINLVEIAPDSQILTETQLDDAVKKWSRYFDHNYGGYNRAPKFMMPGNLDFLLHYATSRKNEKLLEYINLTLTKMAYGGIYDHVAGGFSRYSVDGKWHVPHFEKMLYDNGQLISLYSKAYALTENPLYRKVVEETIAFITSELMDSTNGFYASLDADSLNEKGELEEGAFYVWQKEELQTLLADKYDLFKDYYNINDFGHWEYGNYVLIRDKSEDAIAKKHKISVSKINEIISECKEILSDVRKNRSRPRLDDKILCSWNGLMLKGLTDAYRFIKNDDYLVLAIENATFIKETFLKKEGSLYHNHKDGKSTINGYLEDYASVIDAFIGLYEITFDENWLSDAKRLTDYCIANFTDEKSGLFFFTPLQDSFVIRRTIEKADNVIPSSNSIMAKNLFKLSRFFPDEDYENIAGQMVINLQQSFEKDTAGYANWLHLVLYFQKPYYEISIVGEDYMNIASTMQQSYLPNVVFAGAKVESELSLIQNRYVPNSTLIYLCQHGSCKLPATDIDYVLNQLK
ncbi:MAG: thioredoxin domain-containing protein [Flavobacteriaceae bacterium]|nr:MAG: thioredoxin domain-containing protein [Flavobacteriaceae bacterium]